MTTLIQMQQELDNLYSEVPTHAVLNRIKTMKARIALRNIQIDELVSLTGCRRSLLERKHGEWVTNRVASIEADNARRSNARMLANASNARTQLQKFGM